MTVGLTQLIEDAELIKETLEWLDMGEHDAYDERKAIDRILAYFKERYVPPGEIGAFWQTRGIIEWKEGDEPAEDSIRRIRGG